MNKRWRVAIQWVMSLSILLGNGFVYATDLATQRLDFLHTEHLLAANKTAEFLEHLEKLQDYPLYPYLKAQWLKSNLDQSTQVQLFLARYRDTRYANQVRSAWLTELAKQQRWADIITNYRETDGIDNQCLFNQARLLTGEKEPALLAAKALWSAGTDLPPECDVLVEAFKRSAHFSTALVWVRFDTAMQKNHVSLAQYLKHTLSTEDQAVADFWLQLHNKPELVQSDRFITMPAHHQGALFAYAIQRMAHKEPLSATALWDARADNIHIESDRQQQIDRILALALANNKLPGAYERMMHVTPADEEIQEWRVRAALLDKNWTQVASAVTSLGMLEQGKSKWQYWLARAKEALGDKDAALTIYKQLAAKADYYGFLSADVADLDYRFDDHPVLVDPQLKAKLLARDDLKIVQELKYHQREHEAQKQWWYMVKQLNKQQISVAAKIAEEWQWRQIAIFTLAKADVWDDMNLRFPIFYEQSIVDNATEQAVDPAVIFGLIRQESAFDQEAASPVGARGLMQIMPATGLQIARELKEPWTSARVLYDPTVNIKYGAFYYGKLLQQFNGHFALAAAAYNAGPHRVKSWMPAVGMAADIWVETIPFKETRRYVSFVLSYALIYQQRLQRNGLKMRHLMQEIRPIEKLS